MNIISRLQIPKNPLAGFRLCPGTTPSKGRMREKKFRQRAIFSQAFSTRAPTAQFFHPCVPAHRLINSSTHQLIETYDADR
jgi:hypothetical protein